MPRKKKRNTGKSLLSFPHDFCVIHIKATDYDFYFGEIVEMCALKIRNDEISDIFQTLVKPNNKLDEFFTHETGITDEMVSAAPSLDTVLPIFSDFIGNDIVVGHYVSFDINFIYDMQKQREIPTIRNNYVNTLRVARLLYPEWEHHRLSDLMKNLLGEERTKVRAYNDCEATYRCFEKMRDVFTEKIGDPDHYARERKKNYGSGKNIDIKSIVSTVSEIDETNPLFGKVCVFTGTLENMTRSVAMQHAVNLGAICANSITSKTNYLIIGNLDYSPNIKDGKSTKMKKAEAMKMNGDDIEIISENVFYDILEEYEQN